MTNARLYFRNQKWTRLRVLGWYTEDDNADTEAKARLTFTPLRQFRPGLDETDPEMADPFRQQIIGEFNTIGDLGLLPNPWFICNMLQVEPGVLGNQIKYLLRCSNESYPDLFADAQNAADLYFQESENETVKRSRPRNHYDLLEIQAYDEQVVIRGGVIGAPEYWPKDSQVTKKTWHSNESMWWWWSAKNIFLPANINDGYLGKLLQRVWLALSLFSYPPPPELEDFWQRLQEIPPA